MPALDDPMTQETKSNCTVEEKSTAPLLTLFLDPCCDARNGSLDHGYSRVSVGGSQ
jgi:hypothetical protein